MTALVEGAAIPAVDLAGPDGTRIDLQGYVGKPFVLYFYPKDDTTGCTREAQDFSAPRNQPEPR
jgi:peroxiredoxin Q/BCP